MKDSVRRLGNIIEAEAEGNYTEVALQVHTLKGSARTVGFRELENWASDFEATELSSDVRGIAEIARLLRTKLMELEESLSLPTY